MVVQENNSEGVASIEATILRQITFASQQNDVAVISELVIHNHTEEMLEGLTLTLESSPEVITAKTWSIDRINPETEQRLSDRKLQLSASMLQTLTERMTADITLTLRRGDEILHIYSHELTVLARNEWGGANHMPELLAAFVTPNDPAVDSLLKDASEILRRAGEQHAIDGYQSKSRKRVYTLASAIWSAIAAKKLTYAEPPASFEMVGQKLRSPSHIWERGIATCLDTTTLFAAALEQAGIYPIVTFTKGHAFCGVWLQPQYFSTLTTDDCMEVRKHIAAKELILFETTLVTHEPPATFRQAVSRGAAKLDEEHEHEFVYALDIKQARHRGISPLPSTDRSTSDTGNQATSATVVSMGLDAAPELPAFDFGLEVVSDQAETPQTRLDRWRRKLLDLTKRNRLLNLKPTKTAIRLICPDPALLEDKLADGEKITVIPLEMISGEQGERDPELYRERTGADFEREFAKRAMDRGEIVADQNQRDLERGLIELYRKSRADIREGGANTLFLAIGVLRWKQAPDEQRSYRAPLLLVPVKLERKSARSKVRIVLHDDEPVFNMTLLEMLRQDFDVSIPKLEEELPKDESGIDVLLVWEIVRRAVKDIPGFEVREEVVLSTFSFAKYLMWKDLADRTETLKQSSLVKHLIDNPRDPYEMRTDFIEPKEIDKRINLAELFMPLPADSSQIVAVHASGQNNDFVLEGPPGTGKSQTIANIIAHNLALGRKVLFVSEKMAALDVVYRRLKQHGLGEFCLELHSNKTNKKAVIDHLGHSWKSRQKLTAHEWQEETARLSKLRDDLNSLVGEIHRPAPSGISPFAAIGRAARYQGQHRLTLDWQGTLRDDFIQSPKSYRELEDVVTQAALAFSQIEKIDTTTFSLIQNKDWSHAWEGETVAAAKLLSTAASDLLEKAGAFLESMNLPENEFKPQGLNALSKIIECIPSAAKFDLSLAFEVEAEDMLKIAEDAVDTLANYRELSSKLSQNTDDRIIPNIPVDEFQNRWSESNNAFWGTKFWKQLFIKLALTKAAGKVKLDPETDLPVLSKMQDCRGHIDKLNQKVSATLPWEELDTDVDQMTNRIEAVHNLRNAITQNASDLDSLVVIKSSVKKAFIDGRELLQSGMGIRAAADAFIEAKATYQQKLDVFHKLAKSVPGDAPLADIVVFAEDVQRLHPHLNAWCRWQKARSDGYAVNLGSVIEALELKTVEPDDAVSAFKTAYAKWLAPRIIDDRDALRTFSALEHEDKIGRFRALDQKVAELSVDYIRAKLSGDIPSLNDRNRPQGYGVLAHQMTLQKPRKSVRQLVSEMGDVLTGLTPCLLMSPLSIAQFLPADAQLFDLVVFDEASQITVWDAVGAVARGRNVIVVGDPKQMPPTSFFDRAASDDDDDDDAVQDHESILDEALASGVDLHRLTGHYRSKHESLIAFSNHRYYAGDLITYPACDTRESAVSLVRVDGLYQRGKRTNEKEAKAIVAEVVRRLTDLSLCDKSIGIVTMNTEQQRLVLNLLDHERRKKPELEPFFDEDNPNHVFVRNLETVQGDERAVILISIGFGPTLPGAKTMSMSFGALNRKGGERRLNVLITRASEEKMIFASFDPSMIDLTRTSSQAVHDLKHYLEFAERGPKALGEAVHSIGGLHDYDSDFERAVADGLRHAGWSVHTQVGVSKFRIDLGIVHPEKPGAYLAGIECDGATYHSLPAARDRDRVRHAVLEGLGWSLLRLWSTDYFIDPQGSIDSLSNKLHALVEEDAKKDAAEQAERDAVAAAATQLEPQGDAYLSDIQAEYTDTEEVARLGAVLTETSAIASEGPTPLDGLDNQFKGINTNIAKATSGSFVLIPEQFYDDSYRHTIRGLATDFIDNHGPVTFKYLSDAIARDHGFKRTAAKIRRVITESIKGARAQSEDGDGSTIYWPEEIEPKEFFTFRGNVVGGINRQWADIPHPERLGLAASVLSQHGKERAPENMAKKLNLRSLRATTRNEFESLIDEIISRAQALRKEREPAGES